MQFPCWSSPVGVHLLGFFAVFPWNSHPVNGGERIMVSRVRPCSLTPDLHCVVVPVCRQSRKLSRKSCCHSKCCFRLTWCCFRLPFFPLLLFSLEVIFCFRLTFFRLFWGRPQRNARFRRHQQTSGEARPQNIDFLLCFSTFGQKVSDFDSVYVRFAQK